MRPEECKSVYGIDPRDVEGMMGWWIVDEVSAARAAKKGGDRVQPGMLAVLVRGGVDTSWVHAKVNFVHEQVFYETGVRVLYFRKQWWREK
jgi:hypothetical protein